MHKIWSDCEDMWLIKLVREGFSCGQIADTAIVQFGTGITRGAVSGRIWRLRKKLGDETFRAGFSVGRKYHPPGTSSGLSSSEQWKLWKAKRAAQGIPISTAPRKARPARTYKEVIMREMMNEHCVVCSPGVTIDELTPHTCRWPLWGDDIRGAGLLDQKYCGNEPVDGSPYCEAHFAINVGRVPSTYVRQRGTPSKDLQWGYAA